MRTWVSFGRQDTEEEEKPGVFGRIRWRSSQETSGNERCVDMLSLRLKSILTNSLLGVDYSREKLNVILRSSKILLLKNGTVHPMTRNCRFAFSRLLCAYSNLYKL